MEQLLPKGGVRDELSTGTRQASEEQDVLSAPPAPFPAYWDDHSLTQQRLSFDLSSLQASCVAALTSLLPPDSPTTGPTALTDADRPLAAALAELLEATYELDHLQPAPAYEEIAEAGPSRPYAQRLYDERVKNEDADSFSNLLRQLSDVDAASGSADASTSGFDRRRLRPAVNAVREEMAVERVRILGRIVQDLITQRMTPPLTPLGDHLQLEDDGDVPMPTTAADQHPPEYQAMRDDGPSERERQTLSIETFGPRYIGEGKNGESSRVSRAVPTDKMLQDLDNLTSALDRLYSRIPQYTDQRSAAPQFRDRSPPTRSGVVGSSEVDIGTGDTRLSDRAKMKELEEIWTRIERAHGKRRMREDQRADLERVRGRRAEQREQFLQELYERAEASRMNCQDGLYATQTKGDIARARDLRDRDRFLRDLLELSNGTRMDDQDAVLRPDGKADCDRMQARQTFLHELVSRMQSGRLVTQDYPHTLQDRQIAQRYRLVDSLIDFAESSRLSNQDSEPPTPKRATAQEDPTELVTMKDFFKDGSRRNASLAANPAFEELQLVGYGNHGAAQGNGAAQGESKEGTLRKIKSSIRRKSLGPKSATGPDLSNIHYIAEHQENLNLVTVTLFDPNLPLSNIIDLRSFDPAGCSLPAVEAILTVEGQTLLIPMPVPIYSHQTAQLASQDSHLEAKFSTFSTAPAGPASIAPFEHPLSASELRSLDSRGLCCTFCDRELATFRATSSTKKQVARWEPGGNERFKDLPSEHWAEMMEVWMCHDDPSFTAKLAERTREGFWPDRGQVLVGGSYLLVHPADINRANISTESCQDISWEAISCACGQVLGKARKEDGRPGSGMMRFSKWAIALLMGDASEGGSVGPIRHPLDVFITSDMLELAQAHATYRFWVVDEQTEERKILIWLFNPSARLLYHKALQTTGLTGHSAPHSATSATSRATSPDGAGFRSGIGMRTCKIMYRVLNPTSNEDQIAPPAGSGQIEELRYPARIIERLAAALKESTAVYPEARRKMGMWNIGFLQRT